MALQGFEMELEQRTPAQNISRHTFTTRLTKKEDSATSNERTALCQACNDAFFQLRYRRTPRYRYPGHVTDGKRSAEAGCAFCQLVYSTFAQDPRTGPNPTRTSLLLDAYPQNYDYSPHSPFPPGPSVGLESIQSLKITLLSDHQHPVDHVTNVEHWYLASSALRTDIPRFPESRPLEMARTWIKECSSSHADCCRADSTVIQPTRLIDVGRANHAARLIVSTNTESQIRSYLALSHSWGPHLPASRTTAQNYQQYLQSIPLQILEPNYRDAILVTRGLGYQYLWIDALCIIQDDVLDWQRECSHMEDIYTNAEVTIAAIAAPDSTSGFLKPVRPIGPVCELFDSKYTNDQSPRVAFQHLPIVPTNNQLPLASRAWAFQERLLSAHVLYFGSCRMYFECLTGTNREPVGSIERHFEPSPFEFEMTPWHKTQQLSALEMRRRLFSAQEPRSIRRMYYQCIEAYTLCNLSYSGDILPAISGVARRCGRSLNDHYIAGLWKGDMLYGLSWQDMAVVRGTTGVTIWSSKDNPRNTHFKKPSPQSQTPDIPSWSWASANSAIGWVCPAAQAHSRRHEPHNSPHHAEILDIQAHTLTSDQYGQTSGGHITLHTHSRTFSPYRGRQHILLHTISIFPNSADEDSYFANGCPDLHIDSRYWREFANVDLNNTQSSALKLVAALIYCDSISGWCALALQRQPRSNEYKRVGLITGNAANSAWLLESSKRTLCVV